MKTAVLSLVIGVMLVGTCIAQQKSKPPLQPLPRTTNEIPKDSVARIQSAAAEARARYRQRGGSKNLRGVVPWLFQPLVMEVGSIGTLSQDAPAALGGRRLSSIEVVQVIDDDEMIVEKVVAMDRKKEPPFWLEGFPTTGVADGDRFIGLDSLLVVTGTKRYTDTLGAQRTVMLVEAIPPGVVKAALEQKDGGAKKRVQPPPDRPADEQKEAGSKKRVQPPRDEAAE